MRIAYLDCFSGMSGDMFLGALVDAGVPARIFEETVAALNLGARLEIGRVIRSGIAATKVDVFAGGEKDLPREAFWEQQARNKDAKAHTQEHSHEHTHPHGHDHSHDPEPSRAGAPAPPSHSHEPEHDHVHAHGRGLKEIREIIRGAPISEAARKTALAIFETLGAAEAKVHNTSLDDIHFHEVGAVDAIVDIVCAAVGVEALGADEWVCSPLNVGGGTIHCAHGTFPVPAPATVELLKGAPVFSSGPQVELVTPTGAAIVKVLASRFAAFPPMKIEQAGYGAGTRDFSGHANVVRLTVGEAQAALEATPTQDTVTVLEANLDDMNPQVFGYVMDRLLEEGALDVLGIPVQMKKNRPGMLLTVLASPKDAERLTQLLFAETTTLGVRRREEPRQILKRRWESVETRWGSVRVKVAGVNGCGSNCAPEYEDCRKLAAEHHVPLKTVMQEALQIYLGSAKR
jgi:uncharacterized protein (TIGR00299 family) protein